MENIKNIVICCNDISSECKDLEQTWKTVLGDDKVVEIDCEGLISNCVSDVVNSCTDFNNQIFQAYNIKVETFNDAEPVDFDKYHSKEFFEGLIFDANGNVLNEELFYREEYKVNKMIYSMISQKIEKIDGLAQSIIVSYQENANLWSNEVAEHILSLLQPMLDVVSGLIDVLIQLKVWHNDESYKNKKMWDQVHKR